MTVKNYDKYLELAKIFNKTFGAPSPLKSSTESIIFKLVDETMVTGMFLIVVNFSSEGMWRALRKRWIEEGIDKLKSGLKKAEEEYKKSTGDSISFEIIPASINDGMEFVNYSMYNPKKTAYFRVFCTANIK